MSRGYRIVFLALVGWLSLSGASEPPKSRTAPNQHEEHDHSRNGVPAPAVNPTEHPDKTAEPCERNEDKRYSDLCAQWKAADAAADAAVAGWMQVWIGLGGVVIGLLTLAAAGAAAFYAKQAVDETRSSNAISRDVARVDQRPWVSISMEICKPVRFNERGCNLEVIVKVKNVGQTAARGVHIAIETENAIGQGSEKLVTFLDLHFSGARTGLDRGLVLIPNEEIDKRLSIKILRETFSQKSGTGYVVPLIIVSTTYGATLDADLVGQTSKGFLLSRLTVNGQTSSFSDRDTPVPQDRISISNAYGFSRAI